MNQPDMTPNTIRKPGASPILALILAIFFHNGHLYNNQASKWTVTMLIETVGYFLCILPGLFIWVLNIIDSYQTAERLRSGETIPENEYSLGLLYQIAKVIDRSATCSRTTRQD
ncbi:MAG: hypothetical protein FWG02_08815 [Holophagaceae bacterium]|nr:hypothetical protein [Holophagaceae bacterium]